MDKKSIKQQIIDLDFISAYSELEKKGYDFTFDNLTRDFPKINSQQMYKFLLYAISQKEDVEKHLAICDYLYFIDPYVINADALIKDHLVQSLKISPYNERTLNWVFGIYDGNPDNPFSEEEMENFSNHMKTK